MAIRRFHMSAEDRFVADFEVSGDGCWNWTKAKSALGYGIFYLHKKVFAHRAGYEMFVGPIPEGLQLDHLCRNPSCVNPDHLEPVTPYENWFRGEGSRVFRSGMCASGKHSMDDALIGANGSRYCRHCANDARRARYRKEVGRPVRNYTFKA